MTDFETVKEHSEKLLNLESQARVLGTKFSDNRLVQKTLCYFA